MLLIMLVYGTRPEAIKMAPLVSALEHHGGLQVISVVTGQHREMLDEVNRVFDIRPAVDLDVFNHGAGLHEVSGQVLTRLAPVLRSYRPDAVVVQGDTNSAFAAALAAFYEKIPVVHLEAGLRTGSLDSPFPEEGNRRLITQLASLHLAPTPMSKQNLILEGVPESSIAVVGNTVVDALLTTVQRNYPAESALVSAQFASGRRSVLVTSHRRESWGRPMERVAEGIRRIAQIHTDTDFIFPLHANPSVQEIFTPALQDLSNVILTAPLSYTDLCLVLARAHLVITDSGGLQEEAPALGVPVIVLRDDTERPEALAAGTAVLVGTDPSSIFATADRLLTDAPEYERMASALNPFGDGHAAVRATAAISTFLGSGTRLPDFDPLLEAST